MACWLAGRLGVLLAGWLAGWPAGLPGWPAGWLAALLAAVLAGWLAGKSKRCDAEAPMLMSGGTANSD